MEKIVYSERIRELADILARKLVVRKAKNLWTTAMQHTKNALAVDYSAAMDVSRELDEICTNIPELYVVSGTLNSEPSILNRPLGNQ